MIARKPDLELHKAGSARQEDSAPPGTCTRLNHLSSAQKHCFLCDKCQSLPTQWKTFTVYPSRIILPGKTGFISTADPQTHHSHLARASSLSLSAVSRTPDESDTTDTGCLLIPDHSFNYLHPNHSQGFVQLDTRGDKTSGFDLQVFQPKSQQYASRNLDIGTTHSGPWT